jgi:hypothetical protein
MLAGIQGRSSKRSSKTCFKRLQEIPWGIGKKQILKYENTGRVLDVKER